MSIKTFIPKDHPDLPDNYSMKVQFTTGTEMELELASHHVDFQNGILECRTKDDEIVWIRMTQVNSIQFDKRFSRVIEIRQKMAEQKRLEEQQRAAQQPAIRVVPPTTPKAPKRK